MERTNYLKLYSIPPDYKPPEEHNMHKDFDYPNCNTDEYRSRPIEKTAKLKKFFDFLEINQQGELLLGCNDLNGRSWDSTLWGFKNFENLGVEDKSSFKLYYDVNVLQAKFLNEDMFFATFSNGAVTLWSTRSGKLSQDYCLFRLRERVDHVGRVDALGVNNNKILTGSSDGCLKLWDAEAIDFHPLNTLRLAHTGIISSISVRKTNESEFVTASRDKSCLLWDFRQTRPAIALYEHNSAAFTYVCSIDAQEGGEKIYVGDEAGNVGSIDPKMPNKFLNKTSVYQRPIRKISRHGEHIAIIANTNIIKAYNVMDFETKQLRRNGFKTDGKSSAKSKNTLTTTYEDKRSTDFVRDICWDPSNENRFYTVGWDAEILKHEINTQKVI